MQKILQSNPLSRILKTRWLILLLLFLIGFSSVSSYGMPWDENFEQDIVRANIKEYVLRLCPPDSALFQTYLDTGTTRISENIERDHGVAVLYPTIFAIMHTESDALRSILWHGYIYLVYFAGVIAVFFIGKQLFSSDRWGLFTALVYFLTPRIFADGHYNNKDIVLLSMLLCSIAMFLALIVRYSTGRLIGTAFCAALMCNTRVVGIALFGMIALFYLVAMILEHTSLRDLLKRTVGGLGWTGFFYVLLTPAMWGRPAKIIAYFRYLTSNAVGFTRWDENILFDGAIYRFGAGNPLPVYYLPKMILITLPPYVLLAFGVGVICVLLTTFSKKPFGGWRLAALYLLFFLCIVPILSQMHMQPLIYNGWRHFYFLYGAMAILAVYAFYYLYTMGKHIFVRRLVLVSAVLCLTVTGIGMLANPTLGFGYYNFLAGREAEQNYEFDYWNVSARNALERLSATEAVRDASEVTIATCEKWSSDGVRKNLLYLGQPDKYHYTEDWMNADYVMINRMYAELEARTGDFAQTWQYIRDHYDNILTVSSYGREMYSVYMRR